MKIRWMGLVLFVLFVLAIATLGQVLLQREERNQTEDILNKGNYLVSLIVLHSLQDFDKYKRDFFLRTLTEYVSSEGLAYCFIHNVSGDSLVSLCPDRLAPKIPDDVKTKALNTMGLVQQKFALSGSNDTIYEFAKPIFENGERTGTVRLGFKIAPPSLFSFKRTSVLAMIAFFIIAMTSLVYFGATLAVRPLRKLYQDLGKTYNVVPDVPRSPEIGGIVSIVQDFERNFATFREKIAEVEAKNTELAAELGIITFEKKQVSSIIDSMNFGIIITDIQDAIVQINSYILKLLKKNREEMIDHLLAEVLDHPEIISFISEQGSVKPTTTARHIETTFPEFAPGKIFQVSSSYLQEDDGGVIGKIIFLKNITDERSAESAQEQFIANLSHEFLSPLTNIKSYTELLMDGEISEKEMQKEFYNTINEETDRLHRLVQNLLNISKIEMGALTLDRGLVKTDWLFHDTLGAIESYAHKKDLTIEKNTPDDFPSLMGDKELLKVAIINVLSNAVKYTPEKGTITFSLTSEDSMVFFDVIDTGYGISEEDLPHIFDRSYRSNDPHIKEQSGSGLGLALTSEIIRLHGGEIEVQSQVGQGTHFIVKLPKEEFHIGKE